MHIPVLWYFFIHQLWQYALCSFIVAFLDKKQSSKPDLQRNIWKIKWKKIVASCKHTHGQGERSHQKDSQQLKFHCKWNWIELKLYLYCFHSTCPFIRNLHVIESGRKTNIVSSKNTLNLQRKYYLNRSSFFGKVLRLVELYNFADESSTFADYDIWAQSVGEGWRSSEMALQSQKLFCAARLF